MADDDLPRGSLTFAHLRNRHPAHDEAYWAQLRGLMAGGKRLLGDKAVMDALFPRHPHEEQPVYENRRARAFNIPYPGEIIGELVGQLAQDPPEAAADGADDWYTDTFMGDVDRKGLTLLGYAQAMVREALTVRTAWALVDLPAPPQEEPGAEPAINSKADQEEAGLLRAYVCPVPAEAVIDWEDDDDGTLLWACIWKRTQRRMAPGEARNRVTDTFTFYDCEGWVQYVVTYDPNKPPQDSEAFAPTHSGPHSFGKVPLLRLELPPGLWAMDKLYGTARAHFQQRSAFSYAQVRGLFPLLTAFLGPEAGGGGEVPAEAQQNPGRATEQKYGIGRINVFGKDDRLEYVGPDAGVYTVASKDLDTLRDEMHRVCSAMASATDNSASAIGRSGESKQQDKTAKELVLLDLGKYLGDHLHDMMELVSTGRGDEGLEWKVNGFRTFDQVSAADAVDTATAVGALDIPSPTFKRVFLTSVARRIVAHDASPEQLDDIAQEIEDNVSDEEFAPLPPRPPPGMPPVPGQLPPGGKPPAAGAPPQLPGGPAGGAKGQPLSGAQRVAKGARKAPASSAKKPAAKK